MIERAHINAVHRHLPPKDILHRQSMTGAAMTTNGVPDYYYDPVANKHSYRDIWDLWVEYKAWPSMPRSGIVGGVDNKKRGYYSTLQYEWMERRWGNGGNVMGMIGLPNKKIIVQKSPNEWKHGSLVESAITHKEAASLISNFCGV